MAAIILAICVFLIGLALAVANRHKYIGDTASFLAVLLTPLLVLGVASGVIQEFTGPGGVSAKFRDAARSNVTTTGVKERLSYDVPTQLVKGPIGNFSTRLTRVLPGTPITFTFSIGNGSYDLDVAKDEIEKLLRANSDAVVVINNSDGKFVAMADPVRFYTLLDDGSRGRFLIECLNRGQQPPNYPELIFDSLKDEGTSNADALRKMLMYNLHNMAVTNKEDVVDHIARRDQIVAELVNHLLP
jgi:hypothetical protein